jgi:hypothetical protein
MSQFAEHKVKSVAQAEDAVQRAWVRLQDALALFEALDREREDRGDGFVARTWREARHEASKAQKWYDHCRDELNAARAEAEAPTLWDD